MADFLRQHSFDVKSIGNAATSNYPFTIVVSRTTDMGVARQIAKALGTDKLILLRNGDDMYDVTVILGSDFGEMIE